MYLCSICGRKSKNKNVIDKCKHTRKNKTIENTDELEESAININQSDDIKLYDEIILENVEQPINNIYHCSDIHIRLNSRHDEYRHVFSNFYKMLMDSPIGLIVCCGDILHNKNELSPECVVLCLEFLESLSKIMPTVFIAGNHDAVLTNNERLDSLSAILDKRHIPNLYYLKHSGVYRFRNIVFGVSSLLDNQFVYRNQIKSCEKDVVIGLFHGSVGTPMNDLGFKISGDKPIVEFEGYDLVLLGDIHKFQYLNKEKTIAYSSSLISQNFGECDEWHGYLEWDLSDKSSVYRIVPNDYRFMKIPLGDSLDNVVKNANLEVVIIKELEDTDDEYRMKVLGEKARIANTLPNVKVRYIYNDNQSIVKDNKINSNKMDYSDKCRIYLKTQWPNLVDEDIDWLISKIDFKVSGNSCSKYQLLVMEWDYMGKYGRGNRFDFRNLKKNGISGILANNSMGKSTFIDILTFMLFGKTNRNISNRKHLPIDIINIHQNKCNGRLYFRTSLNILYLIEKTCVRGKDDNLKLTSCFYQLVETLGGTYEWEGLKYEKMALHGKDRLETDKIISDIIGNYDDFIFQSVFLQFDNVSFRTMSPRERKDFMFRLFQLDYFTKQYTNIKELVKKNKAQLEYVKSEISKVDNIELDGRLKQLLLEKAAILYKKTEGSILILERQKCREQLLRSLVPIGEVNLVDNFSKRLEELSNIISKKFQYLDRKDEIVQDYKRKCDEYNRIILELTNEKIQLQLEIRSLVDLDFDEDYYGELCSINFEDDLEYKINDLENRIMLVKVDEVAKIPKYTRQFLEQQLLLKRSELLNLESRLDRLMKQKRGIVLDDTILQRYNKYLQDKSRKDELEINKNRLVEYIDNVRGGNLYNPDCYVCLKNPIVSKLNSACIELEEIKNELGLIYLEDDILEQYQVYSILRDTLEKCGKDVDRLIVNIQDTKLLILEYEAGMKDLDLYEIIRGREENIRLLDEYKSKKGLKDEFNRLSNIFPIYLQNKRSLENNSLIQKRIEEIEMKITNMGQFEHIENSLLELEILEYNSLDEYRKEYDELIVEKSKYNERLLILENNKRIEMEIRLIDDDIKSLNVDYSVSLMLIDKEIVEIEVCLDKWKENVLVFKKLVVETGRYEILGEVLSINGFSLYLLSDKLDMMSVGISEIMSKYMGVNIKLKIVNGDLVVLTNKIIDNGDSMYRLDTFGGKETLIYDISFRIFSVLHLLLPFPDIMIFDETFLSFDTNNKPLATQLLTLFNTYYSNIILITHDNYYKDFIHTPIHITSTNQRSQILNKQNCINYSLLKF